jgi:hypothetical protein
VNELRKRGHSVRAADLFNTDREDYVRADVRNYHAGRCRSRTTANPPARAAVSLSDMYSPPPGIGASENC